MMTSATDQRDAQQRRNVVLRAGGFAIRVVILLAVDALALVVMTALLSATDALSFEAAVLVAAAMALINAVLWPIVTRVVVGVGDPDVARGALSIAVRIARADGGVVHPVLVLPESAPIAPKAARERLERIVAAAGVEGRLSTVIDRSLLDGAVRAGAAAEATLVLIADPASSETSQAQAAGSGHSHSPPVALVRGSADRLGAVRTLLDGDEAESPSVAIEMARRVGRGRADQLDDGDPNWSTLLAPGDVTFVSARAGAAFSVLPDAGAGVVVTMLDERLVHEHEA